MPDSHMPDHVIGDLRRENRRLEIRVHELTDKFAAQNDYIAQLNLAVTRLASENYVLGKRLHLHG